MSQNLTGQLQEIHFSRPNEAAIITAGIFELNNGVYDGQAISRMKTKFGQLALKQNISAEALSFYTILMKPNVGDDVGRSIATWIF